MAIGPVSPVSGARYVNVLSEAPAPKESDGGFANVLKDAFANVQQTDTADKASTLELVTGQSDDLLQMTLDSQKAEIALSLALQVRTKVLDAYNEIMRMQV